MSDHISRSNSATPVRPVALARRSSLLWRRQAGAPRKLDVLGLAIDNVGLDRAAADLTECARLARPSRVVFVNAHVMNCAWSDRAYWNTVASADVRYADGSGLALATRLAGDALVDNVNGTDLLPMLAVEAVRKNVTIFLLGGAPGAAVGSAAASPPVAGGLAEAGRAAGR